MTKIRNLFGIAATASCWLALALYGCSIGPAETTPVRTYLLDPDIAVKNTSANSARSDPATLLIGVPKAQSGFDTARMAYLPRPHELSYYAFNQWADTPGRMLQRPLAQAMAATGLWRAVVQAPSPVRADYRLDCDNLVLEQQFFSRSQVRLALRAQLIDVKRQSVIGTRSFETFAASSSEDAYGGVVAANQASAKLLDQLTDWLTTVIKEEKVGGK
jgi:cholesterol transport system auxiliary component